MGTGNVADNKFFQIAEGGGARVVEKDDEKTPPLLSMTNDRVAHTLHVLLQSADRYRHAVLITHDHCNCGSFRPLPGYEQKYKKDCITVMQHIETGLVVLSCGKDVKTWMGGKVAECIMELVPQVHTESC